MPSALRHALVLLFDVALAVAAFWAAFYLRLGIDILHRLPAITDASLLYGACCALVFAATGLPRHVWRYASVGDLTRIVRAVSLATLAFILAKFFLTRLEGVPRSLPVLAWFVLIMFMGGARLAVRLLRSEGLGSAFGETARTRGRRTNILIIGAGDEAEHFLRALKRNLDAPFNVVGMLTGQKERLGRVIQGVEVLGLYEDLETVIATLERKGRKPARVVIVNTLVKGELVRRFLDIAEAAGCTVSRLPAPTDMAAWSDADITPRPISIDDLLGRPQTRLDRTRVAAMIAGKRVLVTGAGGSIGSELVRQISDAGPAALALVEQSEFAIYSIEMELAARHPDLAPRPYLCDVRDRARIHAVMADFKPDLVFHAAALKHVPMVEANIAEGVKTNILGTRNVADAAMASGAGVMVMISTDKAVNPTNVMGTTKRVAEMICQTHDIAQSATRFVTVRFGNVLGSNGSVVPLFQKQLAAGGPLTVTHPDVERFFMTIPEAVELVLQAATLGHEDGERAGGIHVLEMGQPVKIMDLARQMIRLAGKVPDEDIQIKIVGLRPGEKLKEEIFHDQESETPTPIKGILLARPRAVSADALAAILARMETAVVDNAEPALLEDLHALVPEFDHQRHDRA